MTDTNQTTDSRPAQDSRSLKDSLTAWLSKPQVWGFFVSMAVMALVSVLFFVPNNFNGDTLQQQDMQQGAANGEEGRAYEELTGEKALWTNSLFSGMPTFQISPSYPSNSLFTWLNSVYGLGLPAPSNLLFMMMFGMLIMCYCLRMRWWYALIAAVGWGLSSYFIIIIGAGHIWKFVTLTYVPPTIGALIMAYRGKYLGGAALMSLFAMLQLNANHPQITYYSAFVMGLLALAFLVQDIREKRIKRWLAATGVCLLSGALALGANAPSLYNTYEYSKETKRSQSELTPLKSATAETDPGQPAERPTGGLPKSEIGGWSNMPSESFSLLIPNIKGGASIMPEKGSFRPLSIADTEQFKDEPDYGNTDDFGLSGQLSQYFGGKGTTNGPFYLGALLCALFLLGLLIVRGPVKWALLAATILSVCLAMGNHFEALTDFMIYNFPLYNKFRAAETALVIAALCVPLLAAMALQKLFGKDGGWERYRIQIYISFGLCILIALLGWLAPQIFGNPIRPEEAEALESYRDQIAAAYPDHIGAFDATVDNISAIRLQLVSADALRSLIVLLLGLGAVVLTARRKLAVPAGALAVGMIVLVDLFSVDKRYVSAESFAATEFEFTDPLAADAIDKAISEDKGYYRVMDIPGFGNARRSFHHKMIGGYHAAKLNRYNDLIERRMSYVTRFGYNPDARVDSLIALYAPEDGVILKNLAADYRVLDMLNAKYIITGDSTVVVENPYAAGPAWMARELTYVKNADAEMAALGTIDPTAVAVADERFRAALGDNVPSVAPGDTVVMTGYTPNTLTYDVTTKNGGVCVFSEVWFPWGWKATIDGKPAQLGRVNYVLRALRVPAGSHKVSMTFDPDSIHNTTAAAYICVTLIYLLLLAALFRVYLGETSPRQWLRTHFKRS